MKLLPSIPRIVNCLILFSLTWIIFNTGFYKQERKVIYWDVLEYYSYLPATFIYKDISLKFTEKDPAYFSDKFWPLSTPSGGKVTKMSMGMAVLYSPFFFAANAAAKITGRPATGFTAPYKLALQLSCLFYLCIGLYFLRKTLLLYFNETITALAILAVTVGTNLFYYASFEAPMSHLYSFSLIAIFVHLTIRWYEKRNIKYTILVGLLGGLIALVRPTNVIIFVFFALWGVVKWHDVLERVNLFISNFWLLLLMGLGFILIWIPQLIYWKYNSGEWFYYSYNSQHFFFNDPQFINGLISYRKGWLLYTPMMSLALIGFVFLYRYNRPFFWPSLIFSILNIYIIVSWWTWWYGGGFGLRPMIDSYAILVFPLAAFLKYLFECGPRIKFAGIVLVGALMLHSVFETAQYLYGAIHWDSMTKASYWDSFGRLHPTGSFYKDLKEPDYEKAIKGDRNN